MNLILLLLLFCCTGNQGSCSENECECECKCMPKEPECQDRNNLFDCPRRTLSENFPRERESRGFCCQECQTTKQEDKESCACNDL